MNPDRTPPGAARPAADAATAVQAKARWLWPAALAYLIFPVYGSLLPFRWQAVGWADALQRFSELLSGPLQVASRADFAANVLLAVPLAALWLAAAVGGPGRVPAALAWSCAGLVWLGCTALALGLEFSQIFFSGRSPALSDCVAQSLGAAVGLAAWRAIPPGFWHASRSATVAWRQMQALYLGGLLLYALMPLDLTVSLSELAGKFTAGMVRLVPFSSFPGQPLLALTDALLDTAIWLGAALLTQRAAGRLSSTAMLGLFLFAVGLECAQFLVLSRVVDTTDIITAALGIGLAAAVRAKFQPPQGHDGSAAWLGRAAVPAALILAGVALGAYPFDFVTDTWALRRRVDAASMVPFASYAANGELYLVTNLLRRFFLFSSVGASVQWTLAASTLAGRWHTPVVLGVCAAVALFMELVQLALPQGAFDVGDVLFAAACGAVAAAVARRLLPGQTGPAGPLGGPEALAPPSARHRRHSSRSRPAAHPSSSTPSTLLPFPGHRLRFFAWAGLLALPVALAVVAYLPWTPYNLRELLTSGGMPWPVPPITLALLGLLGLPSVVAGKAGASPLERRAGGTTVWLLFAPVVLASLLHSGVDRESVHDVVGSPVWGVWAGGETVLRLAVLLLGVFWSLALGAAFSGGLVAPAQRMAGATRLLAHGLWVAPLWHAVVVVFAGTDNLTELMAGGGGVGASLCLLAYGVLLGWSACEALTALAGAQPGRCLKLAWRLLGAAVVGYGLARLATESTVVKYGQVFSALQFLLSTDRGHYAGGGGLLARFFLAQLVAVGAAGLSMLTVQWLFSRLGRPTTLKGGIAGK